MTKLPKQGKTKREKGMSTDMRIALSRLKPVPFLMLPGVFTGGWHHMLFLLSTCGCCVGIGLLLAMLIPVRHGGFTRYSGH